MTLWTPALPRCSWLQGSLSCWEYLRQDLLPSPLNREDIMNTCQWLPVLPAFHYPWTSAISRSSFILWAPTSGPPNTRISSLASITSWHTTHTDASTGWLGTYQRQIERNIFEKKNRITCTQGSKFDQTWRWICLFLSFSFFFAVSVDCDVGAWSNTNTLLRGANKINWVGHIPKTTYTRHRTIMIVSKNGFVWEWLTH